MLIEVKATRPAELLGSELHGSLELSYMAPLDFELSGSLIYELLGAFSSSFPWESVRSFNVGL